MNRTSLRSAIVVGAAASLLVLAPGIASAAPAATINANGNQIEVHVTGAIPDTYCGLNPAGKPERIGPYVRVATDGTANWSSGPVADGRHDVEVMCAGAILPKVTVFTGPLGPLYQFLSDSGSGQLIPSN